MVSDTGPTAPIHGFKGTFEYRYNMGYITTTKVHLQREMGTGSGGILLAEIWMGPSHF